jgi:hypothetical protein
MLRTFSKVFGLGGARVGWGYMPAAVADALNRVRGVFNVNLSAQAAAVAARLHRFGARKLLLQQPLGAGRVGRDDGGQLAVLLVTQGQAGEQQGVAGASGAGQGVALAGSEPGEVHEKR